MWGRSMAMRMRGQVVTETSPDLICEYISQARIEGDLELAPHFGADVNLRGHLRQYTV